MKDLNPTIHLIYLLFLLLGMILSYSFGCYDARTKLEKHIKFLEYRVDYYAEQLRNMQKANDWPLP